MLIMLISASFALRALLMDAVDCWPANEAICRDVVPREALLRDVPSDVEGMAEESIDGR
jgi:hypothetical protein